MRSVIYFVITVMLLSALFIGCTAEPAPPSQVTEPPNASLTTETTPPSPTVEPLNADFIASNTKVKVGSTVEFTDRSSGDIDSRLWDFGDSTTSTEQNPSHTYKDPGSYTVSLTVSNASSLDTEEKKDHIAVSNFAFRRLVMCSTVRDLGDFTPQPNAIYHAGDIPWVYFEVRGFEQRKTGDLYEIWLQWTRLRFTDPNGKLMVDAPNVREHHENIQETVEPYVAFWIDIGKAESSDPRGKYTVEITVKDMLSGDTAIESTTFILE